MLMSIYHIKNVDTVIVVKSREKQDFFFENIYMHQGFYIYMYKV